MLGEQTLDLTHDSVKQAIEEYVNRHFISTAPITITRWFGTEGYGAGTQRVIAHFKPVSELET